jgi:hypothetical protein
LDGNEVRALSVDKIASPVLQVSSWSVQHQFTFITYLFDRFLLNWKLLLGSLIDQTV